MGAVSQFAAELALTSCTSEVRIRIPVLVGQGQRKATSMKLEMLHN